MKIVNYFVLFCYLIGNFTAIFAELGSECTTPLSEFAYCIPLDKCEPIKRSLQNPSPRFESFYNASICEDLSLDSNSTTNSTTETPLVCCGTAGDYKEINFASLILQTLPQWAKIKELLPPKKECGFHPLGNKIIGGNETELDEFAWMALLEYRNRYGESVGYYCGGALINSRYILTAAHCTSGTIEKELGKLFRIRLGEYDTRTEIDCVIREGVEDCNDPPEDYYVEEIIAHQDFIRNRSGVFYDISLVRLDRDVNFTAFITPICLPFGMNKSETGNDLVAAGWGRTERTFESPVKLAVNLNIHDINECQRIYSGFNMTLDSEFQICAKGNAPGKDTCSGDSGGPLMRQFPQSSDWYVEGIVSFGPRFCAHMLVPGVYTNVIEYMDWIIENIKE